MLLSPAGIGAPELFPDLSWRSHALLWESQLPYSAWRSLWQAMRMAFPRLAVVGEPAEGFYASFSEGRLRREDGRPVTLHESAPFDFHKSDPIEGPWENPFRDISVPADSEVGGWLREVAFRKVDDMTLVLVHGVAPYWRHVATEHFWDVSSYPAGVDTAALLDCLLLPHTPDAAATSQLSAAYLSCLELFENNDRVQALLMRNLEADAGRLGPELVLPVLKRAISMGFGVEHNYWTCLLYTSPSPRDQRGSRMPSSA